MSYRKVGNNKYRVEEERTIKGERYRRSEVIETKKVGSELKALVKKIELKLQEEIKLIAGDPKKLREMKYEEYARYFIENHDVEQKTKEYYEDNLLAPRTLEFFKIYKIIDINETLINDFFDKLKTTVSERTGKPLSKKTIKHYHTCLKVLFNDLIKRKIIKSNPVEIKITSQRNTIEIGFYGPTEIKEIGDALIDYGELDLELYFHLIINTGMRPSEVRALEWPKIDFSREEVLINEAIVKTRKGYIRKSTKTEDTRITKLSSYVVQLLKILKENNKLNINGFVLTSDDGTFIKENTLKGRWNQFCKKYGFRYISPYGLRHSSATLLAYNKVPIPNISKHMGHTNHETTQKYIHATKEGDAQIENIMEQISKPTLKVIKN